MFLSLPFEPVAINTNCGNNNDVRIAVFSDSTMITFFSEYATKCSPKKQFTFLDIFVSTSKLKSFLKPIHFGTSFARFRIVLYNLCSYKFALEIDVWK